MSKVIITITVETDGESAVRSVQLAPLEEDLDLFLHPEWSGNPRRDRDRQYPATVAEWVGWKDWPGQQGEDQPPSPESPISHTEDTSRNS